MRNEECRIADRRLSVVAAEVTRRIGDGAFGRYKAVSALRSATGVHRGWGWLYLILMGRLFFRFRVEFATVISCEKT